MMSLQTGASKMQKIYHELKAKEESATSSLSSKETSDLPSFRFALASGKEGLVQTDESYLRSSRSAERRRMILIFGVIKAEVLVIEIRCGCCV
jgi:hypothetical protein